MRLWTLFVITAFWLLLGIEGRAEELCGTCHPDVKTEYVESVHAKELGCTKCHGGDPMAIEVEQAHAVDAGYLGKPRRIDIPALCASCHADPRQMKSFGLATDQYAQYQTSGHGRRLALGDTRVAVCTDCHGTHGALSAEEPTSPVAQANISATCGRCHSDQALMAQYELPANQVEKFRQSVHGVALLVENHPSAPTCATCHGAHGAIAWEVSSLGAVCGHCHSRTREYFEQSAHKSAVDEGKMSECISCHGYHDTSRPDRTLFDTACQSCHAPDSAAFLVGQKLKTMLNRANEAIAGASEDMGRVVTRFPTVRRYYPRLQQAEAAALEALPVQHSLALDRVDDLTRTARSIAEDVQASVHGVQQESQLRYVVLALGWLFILFAVALAYLYRKERQRERS